jgi:hypothetical protein
MRTALVVLVSALAACTFHFHVHEAPPAPAPAASAAPAAPLAGTWQVRGEDSVPWSAQLVLDADTQAGYFDWSSDVGRGRELVTWSFDPRTGTVDLAGHALVEPRGRIGVGTYRATLAGDGTRLEDGTWGPPALPGTWVASR